MKFLKNLDLKSALTLLAVLSLILFVAYILWNLQIDKEIAMLFFGVFTVLIQKITDYYFTRKDKGKEGE